MPQGATEVTAEGRLTFIDNTVDAQTGTIRLGATFDNDDGELWPGQFVTAQITLQEQADVIVVPSVAIQNGPKGQYVYVVKPDGTAELREIVVERTEGERAVVAEGPRGRRNGGDQRTTARGARRQGRTARRLTLREASPVTPRKGAR